MLPFARRSLGVLIGLLALGCATELEPAPQAQTVPGLEDAARRSVEHVSLIAKASAWPGPIAISDQVTPLQVRIQNDSERALLVRYVQFSLVDRSGRQYAALPPLEIEGSVKEPVQGAFGYRRFMGAPHYTGRYRHFPLHAGPYPYDPFYYDTYHGYWAEFDLPTQEMIQRALPEGVLEPGGYVQGWLYFEKVSDDASSRAVFRADLVDQASGRTFGEVRIPFLVE